MFFALFCLAAFGLLFAVGLEVKFKFFSRDLGWGLKLLRALLAARLVSFRGLTTADFWEWRVRKTPRAIGLVFEGREISFESMDAHSNQICHWLASSVQISRGDVVAILMENRPEFIYTWIALSKLGATASLLNTNLRDKSLLHTLTVCEAKVLIFGVECAEAVSTIAKDLPTHQFRLFSVGGDCSRFTHPHNALDASQAWLTMPTKSPDASIRTGSKQNDTLFFIYTSGTTGLPKAAKIKHSRFISAAQGFSIMSGVKKHDRIFCPLPIYHSAAGILGIGMSWDRGCSLVMVRRFSASKFWVECIENKCTVMQYVGELCRFLVAQPASQLDSKHTVRLAIGNGMRPEVWRDFVCRFGVKVCEFYGSTEGNVTLVNNMGTVGAVGYLPLPLRLPPWLPVPPLLRPFRLVKFDTERDEPARDKSGFCTPCRVGEVGVILGKIVQTNPAQAFEGYTNPEATQKKILNNVFKQGDSYFMSGDLLRMDAAGFFYFVDRVGDTFRWKGENVSTLEVAEALSRSPLLDQRNVNVYGVSVPNADGRCGMACIEREVPSAADLQDLAALVKHQLPTYAWPIFLRFTTQTLELTGTFKQRKVNLVNEGFNPSTITSDALFVLTPKSTTYIPLTPEVYSSIVSGTIRL